LTQECLAHVRRASVTVPPGMLQEAELITCQRGHVNIVDQPRRQSAGEYHTCCGK